MSVYSKLAEVQKELRVNKGGYNPHFKSDYFELPEILNQLRPLLAKHKLLLYQGADGENVVTKLIDLDKEDSVISSSIKVPANLDAQKLGSAYTYLKRYSLTGMFLIDVRDDDGNLATFGEEKTTIVKTSTNVTTGVVTGIHSDGKTETVISSPEKKKVSFSKKAFSKPTAAPAATGASNDDDL